MDETKTYEGGCHCGRVRYEVRLDLSKPVMACNCSMCGRAGTLLTFVPTDEFSLRASADALTDYRFNKHAIHHVFCNACGIKSFARGQKPDGAQMIAINARCLDGVDLEALTIAKVDGKSR
jgi:hypothetical protein